MNLTFCRTVFIREIFIQNIIKTAVDCHLVYMEWLYTGFGLVNSFIDHLQGVTINNYNTIAISTHYSSLEHTI
jgi:hypothetical protein